MKKLMWVLVFLCLSSLLVSTAMAAAHGPVVL